MTNVSDFFVRKHPPKEKTCFILMPFHEDLTAVYEHGIKPTVETLGLSARRADEIYSGQSILGDIWESIQTAEIIIADLTKKNPNVMYELGLCHTLWKRVVLLSQTPEDVPFDLRNWRVIYYDFSFAGSARLKEELQRAIETVRAEKATEADIVPLKTFTTTRAQPDAGAPGPLSEWHFGRVTRYDDYGFIRDDNGEDFFFGEDLLFSETSDPRVGTRVYFLPIDAAREGQKRRASKVFVYGERFLGVVNRVTDSGFGFADIAGQGAYTHNMFFFTRDLPDVSEGDEVELEVDENKQGPIGRNARVV